jgi:flagellar basal body L-ring protein FlgH
VRSVKSAGVVGVFLILAALAQAGGESLWSPGFKGYLSGSKGLAVGDALVVRIDATSSLSFSSSSNDSKSLTLEFAGGASGNLFSFLPQVRTGGTRSTTGKDSLNLKAEIPVVVTALNADGTVLVQGSRSISVAGKSESITVSGALSAALLDQKGLVDFSKLANARLVYTTFLDSARDVLSQADLQQMLAPAAAAPAATAPATGAAPAASTAPATATATAAAPATAAAATPTLAITEARKKELLLLYLNRLLDVIFPQ